MGVSSFGAQGDRQPVLAALSKRRQGLPLTVREERLIASYEAKNREKIGSEYVRQVPKARLVEWSGRQPKQWLDWSVRYQLPYRAGKDVPYVDLTSVIRWLAEFLARNHELLSQIASDPLMFGGNSPSIERWRAAKADMAEDERDERRRKLLPLDAVHDIHTRWASRLRKAGEVLARRYGNDAADILRDALIECRDLVEQVINDSSS